MIVQTPIVFIKDEKKVERKERSEWEEKKIK